MLQTFPAETTAVGGAAPMSPKDAIASARTPTGAAGGGASAFASRNPTSTDRYVSPPKNRIIATSPPTSPGGTQQLDKQERECDYDVSPTELYQAIEAKQWKFVRNILDDPKQHSSASRQARTWVVRKEKNGKLRWRLLPLHAAIIFQGPVSIVEDLLERYPQAASSKDDQGMLPLHLAFRNDADDGILEELLGAYPRGIDVKDRKGRTPLQCAPNNSTSGGSKGGGQSKYAKRGSVIQSYAAIAISREKALLASSHRSELDRSINALKAQHTVELSKVKRDHDARSNEQLKSRSELENELKALAKRNAALALQVETSQQTETELLGKIAELSTAVEELAQVKRTVEVRHATERQSWHTEKEQMQTNSSNVVNDLTRVGKALQAENEALRDKLNGLVDAVRRVASDERAREMQERMAKSNRELNEAANSAMVDPKSSTARKKKSSTTAAEATKVVDVEVMLKTTPPSPAPSSSSKGSNNDPPEVSTPTHTTKASKSKCDPVESCRSSDEF